MGRFHRERCISIPHPRWWTKEPVLEVIALVPAIGRQWHVIAATIGMRRRSCVKYHDERAHERKMKRCIFNNLDTSSPWLPEDFTHFASDERRIAVMRTTAQQAVVEVNRKLDGHGTPQHAVKLTWSIEDRAILAIERECS